jgi:membrane-associated protease RseP (regulator of RpoE activity)
MGKAKIYITVAGIVLATLGILDILYFTNALGVPARVALAFIALFVSGIAIQRAAGLNGGFGFYMVSSRKGLRAIDSVSKKNIKFWDAMAVWGLTLGFGLVTYPLVKGKMDKRVFALGILTSIAIMLFVLPQLLTAYQFISIPWLQSAISSQSSSPQGASLVSYAITAVTVVFGFSGFIIFSILWNAASILMGVGQFLLSYASGAANISALSSQVPGVAPLIPGFTIPLVAGIASLLVLMCVHEMSHGVLARMAKVRLKSLGVVAFGMIPFSAYVDLDERMVKKLDAPKQTRIFAAGVAANFMAMFVFFALTLIIVYCVAPTAYSYGVFVTGTAPGYPANGVLKSGMRILEWNGQSITSLSTLVAAGAKDRPNGTVSVVTGSGTFLFKAVAEPGNSSRGIIGVDLGEQAAITTLYAKLVYFLYTFFALSMLLNFFVALVNLLPVWVFDGWRVYKANIKSDLFINALAWLIFIGILVNILPWIFYI